MNILHFTPYFPPHIWWLETVAYEITKYLKEKWHRSTVLTYDIFDINKDYDKIYINNKKVWYIKEWVEVFLLPAFEVIPYFPFPKFWTRNYKDIMKYISNNKYNVVQTHTRFFLSSYIWWLYAKKRSIHRVHTEHWADYVRLKNKIYEKIAYIFDRIIWKRILKNASKVITISKQSYDFVYNEFGIKSKIIHRGIEDINLDNKLKINISKELWEKIILWFIWRITERKNVKNVVKSYYKLVEHDNKYLKETKLVIVWQWDQFDEVKKLDKNNIVIFTWWLPANQALTWQSCFDIHIHSSNKWWWLATTLIQAMQLWCYIVSTPYEWWAEVIKDWQNWTLVKGCSEVEIYEWLKEAILCVDNKKNIFSFKNLNFVKKEFSREKNIELYIQQYKLS